MRNLQVFVVGLMLVACSVVWAAEIDSQVVISDYIKALGGEKALLSIGGSSYAGFRVTDVHWETPPYDVVEILAETPSSGEPRMYELSDRDCQKPDKPQERKLVNESDLLWLLSPQHALNIEDRFGKLEYAGEAPVGENMCYVLSSSDQQQGAKSLYFDCETGLLLRVGSHLSIVDYRLVDGVMTPTQIVYDRKGGNVTYFFKSIKHARR